MLCDDLEGWVGGRLKRERTYEYLWPIPIVERHKPTQYYNAIILQLKKKIWAVFPIQMLVPPVDIQSIPFPLDTTWLTFSLWKYSKITSNTPHRFSPKHKETCTRTFQSKIRSQLWLSLLGHSHKLQCIINRKTQTGILERLSPSVGPNPSSFYQVLLCLVCFWMKIFVLLLFYCCFLFQMCSWITFIYLQTTGGGWEGRPELKSPAAPAT